MHLLASVRMNEHYAINPVSPAFSRFRRENPKLLIGRPGETLPEGSVEWGLRTGLNYAFPEVRSFMADILTELIEQFEIDGLELDFMRHPAYFRPEQAYANQHLMTDLLRFIRERMNQVAKTRGRNVILAARVPPTLGDAARIGLDVREWISGGLLDVVIAGGGFIPLFMPLEEFVHAAQSTGCQVYGCMEHLRPAMDDAVIRAIAARFWHAGADGLYLFNYFGKSNEWKHRILDQIADPERLRYLNKRYHLDHTDRLVPRDLHDYPFRQAVPAVQLPVTLIETLTGRGPVLRLKITDDIPAAQSQNVLESCVLRLNLDHYKPETELEVWINGDLLSSRASRASFDGWRRLEWTQSPQRVAEVSHPGGTLEYDLLPSSGRPVKTWSRFDLLPELYNNPNY